MSQVQLTVGLRGSVGRTLLVIAALQAGCIGGPQPQLEFSLGDHALPARIVPGVDVDVEATWYEECEPDLEFDAGDGGNSYPTPCHFQRFLLELSCEGGPCDVPGATPSKGVTDASVTPRGPGRFVVTAKMTHDDSGEVYSRSTTVEVTSPEALDVTCYPKCDGRGVRAAQPEVEVFAHISDAPGIRLYSSQIRVNGVVPTYQSSSSTQGWFFSLAELFPDRRSGDGVQPGTYVLDLDLDGVTATYSVNAVP
ncbi:MAG: hypothetical protein H6Q90_2510 [Deltaproteobacteria bacterium]|nr:hypothetical protein [Deltaproteobacteria bacterium]